MPTLLIGFAANFAARQSFQSVYMALHNLFPGLKASTPEMTPPLQQTGPWYLNALFMIDTSLPLSAIQRVVKLIEDNSGRIKLQKKVISADLDVLACGNDILRSELMERGFNRRALQELLPDYANVFNVR